MLRRRGLLSAGSVRRVDVLETRETITALVRRLRVAYDGDAADAPATLFVKSGLPKFAQTPRNEGREEVAFYESVAAAMSYDAAPRCFDASWDDATKAWHLVLEDLEDSHSSPKAGAPLGLGESVQAVRALARFHAAWWDDSRLGHSIGSWLDPDGMPDFLSHFSGALARLADRFDDALATSQRELYQKFISAAPRLYERYHSHRNLTVIHGDAHSWNFLLPRNGGDDVRMVDWEGWTILVAAMDLAYMMILHWQPHYRRALEPRLLDEYHAALLNYGVRGYDRRALDDDYRFAALWQITIPIWQADSDMERSFWEENLNRALVAVDDLGCRELLG